MGRDGTRGSLPCEGARSHHQPRPSTTPNRSISPTSSGMRSNSTSTARAGLVGCARFHQAGHVGEAGPAASVGSPSGSAPRGRRRRGPSRRRRGSRGAPPKPSKANECLGSLRDAQGRLKRFEESVGFFAAEPIARLRVVVDKHDERLTPGFGRFLLWIVLYAKASHQRSGRLGLRSRRSPRTTPTNASLLSRAGPPVRTGTRRLSTRQ